VVTERSADIINGQNVDVRGDIQALQTSNGTISVQVVNIQLAQGVMTTSEYVQLLAESVATILRQ
jgi:hypothetical protein